MIRAKQPHEIRLIGVCDPHLSAHNPISWKIPYLDTTFAALESVFKFAEREQADAILWAGDVFNLKSPLRNPLWFLSRVLTLLRSAPALHLGIAGNHDLKFGSLKGLAGQPIEVLIKAGVFHLLDNDPMIIETEDGLRVRVAGGSYEYGRADNIMSLEHGPENTTIALAHIWFGPQSGALFGEQVYGPDTLSKAAPDVFLIGHHHEDQGVVQRDEKIYISPGSVTRLGAHPHDLTRSPSAVSIVVTKEETKVTILRPRFPIPEEHLDQTRREELLEERRKTEEFIQVLAAANQASTDPRDILAAMEMADEVRTRTIQYLESAEEIK